MLQGETRIEDLNETEKIKITPSTRIEELNFSKRGFNCLKRTKIDTVKDLLELTYEEIANIRNLGSKTLKEIMSKIEEIKPIVQEEPEKVEAVENKIENNEKLEIEYDDSDWEFIFEEDKLIFEEQQEQETTEQLSELELLKLKLAELTEKSNSLQEELKEAKKLLESYEKLVKGITQSDDNSNPDFKD